MSSLVLDQAHADTILSFHSHSLIKHHKKSPVAKPGLSVNLFISLSVQLYFISTARRWKVSFPVFMIT